MHTSANSSSNAANGQGNRQSALAKAASAVSLSGVSHEFQSLLVDIEELIKETGSLTGEELVHARDRLAARVDSAKASINEMGSNIAQGAKRSASVTNEYVHEHPWKVLGVSAAVTFLLGIALARRS